MVSYIVFILSILLLAYTVKLFYQKRNTEGIVGSLMVLIIWLLIYAVSQEG